MSLSCCILMINLIHIMTGIYQDTAIFIEILRLLSTKIIEKILTTTMPIRK